jgi:hypothetical protein
LNDSDPQKRSARNPPTVRPKGAYTSMISSAVASIYRAANASIAENVKEDAETMLLFRQRHWKRAENRKKNTVERNNDTTGR